MRKQQRRTEKRKSRRQQYREWKQAISQEDSQVSQISQAAKHSTHTESHNKQSKLHPPAAGIKVRDTTVFFAVVSHPQQEKLIQSQSKSSFTHTPHSKHTQTTPLTVHIGSLLAYTHTQQTHTVQE